MYLEQEIYKQGGPDVEAHRKGNNPSGFLAAYTLTDPESELYSVTGMNATDVPDLAQHGFVSSKSAPTIFKQRSDLLGVRLGAHSHAVANSESNTKKKKFTSEECRTFPEMAMANSSAWGFSGKAHDIETRAKKRASIYL